MGGAALIAAIKYVCGGGECVCGCDCVGLGVIVWVRKGVCWWGSLDCCSKLCVRGMGSVCVHMWV